MFVRKGTVRKNRGGANRRSTRRHAGSNGQRAKSHVYDDPSSTGSYRLSVNDENCATKSASSNSLRLAHDDGASIHSAEPIEEESAYISHAHKLNGVKSNGEHHPHLTEHAHLTEHTHLAKPSPARSVANTVVQTQHPLTRQLLEVLSDQCVTRTEWSFDDERKLVRTSVGWDSRYGDDLQPEYGAFMYQINEASKEADNILDFVCKTSTIICNTIFVTVIVGLSMALPIAMVSIGVKYLDECPREPRIPVYLLVGGCFGMIKLLSTLWRNIQSRRYQDAEVVFDDHDADGAFASTTYRTMDTILMLFLVGWQVAGTYWSLEIWTPHFHQLLHEPSNWCDRTVYMFSIYQIFGCYGLMALYILVLLFIMCCQKCRRQF